MKMLDSLLCAELRKRLTALFSRTELRHWPWKIELNTTLGGHEIIFISEHVRDRDSGEPRVLGGMAYGMPSPTCTDRELITWVYAQLQRHVLHELAEAFHVDGERVFDPHLSSMNGVAADLALQALDAHAADPPKFMPSFKAVISTPGKIPPAVGGSYLTKEEVAAFVGLGETMPVTLVGNDWDDIVEKK